MRPKFEVGEVVILQSVSQPHQNGETTVLEVGEGKIDGKFTFSYQLEGKSNLEPFYGWAESALRKKHTPGELSFTDLMASLSSPKLITHTPQ